MPNDPDIHAQPVPPAPPDGGVPGTQPGVSTAGGDYAEGPIDKRQGTFVDGDQFNQPGDFRGATLNIKPTTVYQWVREQPADPQTRAAAQALLDYMPTETLPDYAPLPAGSRMPHDRNPLFVGRVPDLRQIAVALKGGATAAIGQTAAATGLGGIGKTNLATEFVQRYGQFFAGGVFWLSFGEPANIPLEIAACGGAGGLNLRPDFANLPLAEQVATVQQSWQSAIPRLLVFDNCDSDDAALLVQRYRPTSGACRVLLTSRRAHWDASLAVKALPLGVLARAESIHLLQQLRPDIGTLSAADLAAEVGDLPLALHLAGSFLRLFGDLAVTDYLAELRSAALLGHESLQGVDLSVSPTNHTLHVARTFALSYDRLDVTNPGDALARALLACAACCAPGEPIPQTLLLATVPQPDAATTRQARRALLRLSELGLLDTDTGSKTVTLHRLLAQFVQQQDAVDATTHEAIARAIIAGVEQARADWNTYRQVMLSLQAHLRAAADRVGLRQNSSAFVLSYYMAQHLARNYTHSEAMPYYERARMIATACHDRLGEANTLQAIGDVQQFRKEMDAALASYQAALSLYRLVGAKLGEANTLQAIGDVQQFRKEMDAALASYQAALSLYRLVGDRLGEANTLKAIGDVQQFRDERDAALASYQAALSLYRLVGAKLGEANTLQAIGDVQQFRDERDAALASYQAALSLYRLVGDRLGEANTLKAIGDVQQFRDERDAALASYQAALSLYRLVGAKLGEANTLQAIGDVQQFRKEMDAALASYQAALSLYRLVEAKLGEANTLQAIGDVQQFRDERDAALASYQAALSLYRLVGAKLGEANTLKAIGDVQQFRKEMDAALASYQAALSLYRLVEAKLGEANTLKAIGDVQQFRDERDAALASYQAALSLYRLVGDRLGEANTLQAIGDVQQFRDERDAALASYQAALSLYRLVGDRLGEANTLKAIGDVQQFRKEMDAALASYQAALSLYRLVEAKLGEANVYAALGQIALMDGRQPEADQLLEQAIHLFKAIGARYSVAAQIGNYGWALRRAGRHADARPYLLRAAELFAALQLADYAARHRQAAEGLATETREQQIARLIKEAETAVAAALTEEDATQRATLSATLEQQAQWAADGELADSPYLALAAHLRRLVAQLNTLE